MLSADGNDNKPIGKVNQRKKAEGNKKSEPRKRKDAQKNAQPAPKPEQVLEALQRLGAQPDEVIAPVAEPVASAPVAEPVASEPVAEPVASEPVAEPVASAPVLPTESAPSEAALVETLPAPVTQPADATPVSLRTIADAYGDYSKKSLEQTSSFVAKLAGARSLANAFELQTAFAREAYETFMEQSRRIRELHRELAKQRLTKLEGFVGMARGR
jgi:hypothetical protein